MVEAHINNGYEKSKCSKCGAEVEPIGVGSASGRLNYQHCGITWWGKNPAAVALGSLGGKARAAAMSPEQRKAQAVKAAPAGGRARALSMTQEQRSAQAKKAAEIKQLRRRQGIT